MKLNTKDERDERCVIMMNIPTFCSNTKQGKNKVEEKFHTPITKPRALLADTNNRWLQVQTKKPTVCLNTIHKTQGDAHFFTRNHRKMAKKVTAFFNSS